MKKIAFLFSLIISVSTMAQKITIVPQPAEIIMPKIAATFTITKNTSIILEGSGLEKSAKFFNDYLQRLYGFKLNIVKHSIDKNSIVLNFERMDNPVAGAYTMTINNNGIYIAGDNEAGAFYGIQTLIQLLPVQKMSSLDIPYISIKDYPRFQYRGMHLDVSRHFFPVEYIKKYIDYLAYHKLNNFHWHLTDDQGWRVEIKKYPLLTSIGGFRNGTLIGRYPGTGNDSLHYGGFYTQKEVKEVVRYAQDRYITVIPEIEMPGHSSAAIAAYPQLSCFPNESTQISSTTSWSGSRTGKQVQQTWGVFEDVYCPSAYTFKFIENVLDEVIQLFPSKYIHIGGDECPKTAWKRSSFCQKLIKEKKLKDEHGLQSFFISTIEKYINSKGRKIIGWDEILEGGLAPAATVMSWRGEKGGIAAARQHHDVIMTPDSYFYFDYSQTKNEDSITIGGYLPLETVYGYEPVPKELNEKEANYVLGAQANLWTEYIQNTSKLEYMIFPRMGALSEVLWTKKENKNWNEFEAKLPVMIKRYELWGANYSTAYFDLQASVLPEDNYDGVLLKLDSKFQNGNIKYEIGDSTSGWQIYKAPLKINSSTRAGAFLEINGKKSNIISKNFSFNKATGKKITLKEQSEAKYAGSGAFTLVNGIVTTKKLSESSEWLGFLGKDLEATIDLGDTTKIKNVSLNVLEQNGSWIYLPKQIEVAVSTDGQNYTSVATISIDSLKDKGTRKFTLPVNTSARFIKVIAKNLGIIPSGLPGAGNPAWLFADEIEVE
ncbi:MAG: family 20 glycosylhydrolase [Ginsengibacter sp.]